jgi:DNA mismatch endonuclease (patch repair protein)
MRRIRKTNTKPELTVRRAARRMGYRFRLHRRDLPGTPDLVFPSCRKIIQVHGCFWHQHSRCRLARIPKSRPDYWLPKLRRNTERDAVTEALLSAQGWEVLIIWECEVADEAKLETTLRSFLS